MYPSDEEYRLIVEHTSVPFYAFLRLAVGGGTGFGILPIWQGTQ